MQKIIPDMSRLQFFAANLFRFMQLFDRSTGFGYKWLFYFWHFIHFFGHHWAKMTRNWQNTIFLSRIDKSIFVVPICYKKKSIELVFKTRFSIFANFGTAWEFQKLSIKSLKKAKRPFSALINAQIKKLHKSKKTRS